MKDDKHTPGPWKVDVLEDLLYAEIFVTSPENIVIHTKDIQRTNLEAISNAALIAAAPELLEALCLLVDEFQNMNTWYTGYTDMFDQARAAIAKARGTQ